MSTPKTTNTPYSIHVNKRPLRIAFLVNPKEYDPEHIEAIIRYNQRRWGGRFNPFIFTDGQSIDEKWWQFLKDFDPDVIKPLTILDKTLIDRIERLIAPYLFDDPPKPLDEGIRYNMYLVREALTIDPTPESIAKVSRGAFFLGNPKLVHFDVDDATDEQVKLFIRWNFGTYDKTIYVDRVLARLYPFDFEK